MSCFVAGKWNTMPLVYLHVGLIYPFIHFQYRLLPNLRVMMVCWSPSQLGLICDEIEMENAKKKKKSQKSSLKEIFLTKVFFRCVAEMYSCSHVRIIAHHHLYLQRRTRWGHSHLLVSLAFHCKSLVWGFLHTINGNILIKTAYLINIISPLQAPLLHFNVFCTDNIKPNY